MLADMTEFGITPEGAGALGLQVFAVGVVVWAVGRGLGRASGSR